MESWKAGKLESWREGEGEGERQKEREKERDSEREREIDKKVYYLFYEKQCTRDQSIPFSNYLQSRVLVVALAMCDFETVVRPKCHKLAEAME